MMQQFLQDAALTLGWAVVGAVAMALSYLIFIKVFGWFTPLDEWDELKKGNLAVAILLAAGIIATAVVVSVAIAPG
jgi:uncharacterized membrane protein YjfL (UPF0719 family)